MAKKEGKKTSKSKKKEIPKTVNKKLRFIIPLIVIICVIGIVWFFFISDVAKADEPKAQLVIEFGDVQVKKSGESWTVAENGMDLYESDSIKTGDNSSASIILFKSSIIRLDSNTEIIIKELIEDEETSVTIQQDAGRTWNTVSEISGIDNYDVQTPTATASVRGTSFDVNIDENGTTVVGVIKGIVNVTVTEDGIKYTVELNESYSITVSFDEVGQPQTFDQDEWINNSLLKDEEFKTDLKEVLYERINPYLDELRTYIDIPDDDIEILINGFIEGEFTLPPDLPDEYKKLFELP